MFLMSFWADNVSCLKYVVHNHQIYVLQNHFSFHLQCIFNLYIHGLLRPQKLAIQQCSINTAFHYTHVYSNYRAHKIKKLVSIFLWKILKIFQMTFFRRSRIFGHRKPHDTSYNFFPDVMYWNVIHVLFFWWLKIILTNFKTFYYCFYSLLSSFWVQKIMQSWIEKCGLLFNIYRTIAIF